MLLLFPLAMPFPGSSDFIQSGSSVSLTQNIMSSEAVDLDDFTFYVHCILKSSWFLFLFPPEGRAKASFKFHHFSRLFVHPAVINSCSHRKGNLLVSGVSAELQPFIIQCFLSLRFMCMCLCTASYGCKTSPKHGPPTLVFSVVLLFCVCSVHYGPTSPLWSHLSKGCSSRSPGVCSVFKLLLCCHVLPNPPYWFRPFPV